MRGRLNASCRLLQKDAEGYRHAFAPILAGAEHPTFESINRLARECEFKQYFDGAWALRPGGIGVVRGATLTPKRLSHAGRLATMGASVAHANRCGSQHRPRSALGFLARERPDLAKATEALYA